MSNRFFLQLLSLVILGWTTGCFEGEDRNIPNVDNIKIDLEIKHFEQKMVEVFDLPAAAAFDQLNEEFPDFFEPVFVNRMLPSLRDTVAWNNFMKSPIIHDLFDTTALVFRNFSPYKAELTEAFQFYKHYFPNRTVPKILTYASEYNYGNFTLGEDLLGIGLDFFLGSDYTRYPRQVFPQYVLNNMTSEHLVSKTMETFVNEIVPASKGTNMLDDMIRNGKVLYILDHLLPHAQDSIKLGYTGDQTQWVDDNELNIWTFFVGEELLYSSQYKDYRKYVDTSPNSPGMPEGAPGRTANWLGWQIIKQYMAKFPDKTLEDLIAETDPQRIFSQAKYKPKR